MPGTNTVTAAIARAGHPEVELVRGDGYHYYVFDNMIGDEAGLFVGYTYGDTLVMESHSIMCPNFGDRPHADWVASGITFAERVKAGTYDTMNTHDL